MTEQERQAALGALDWLIISLDMSHEAWCDSASWRDNFIEKCDVISAALQSPRAPDDVKYHELCKQCWGALGITEYTGKSIPEHIAELQKGV